MLYVRAKITRTEERERERERAYHYSIKIFIIIFSSESQIAGTGIPDNGPHGPVGIDYGVN